MLKIRDKRNKGWFFIDNEYLNGYAKIFGAIGTAIYVSLCRHADSETQQCFPSMELMAEELSISRKTISKYLKLFEKNQLIKIEKERDNKTKKWLNNIYTLLDKEEWKTHENLITMAIKEQKPCEPVSDTHVNPLHNNNTHINNTNIYTPYMAEQSSADKELSKNIQYLIGCFKGVNPSYKRMYANKTQRACIARLIKEHGIDKIKSILEAIPETNKVQYAPIITTPLQLETKLGAWIAFKDKNNKPQVKKMYYKKTGELITKCPKGSSKLYIWRNGEAFEFADKKEQIEYK